MRSQLSTSCSICLRPAKIREQYFALRLFSEPPHLEATQPRCSMRSSAGYSFPWFNCSSLSETCWMRRAIPKPCIGPIESRVFNTSKSSVPCRTSDLGDGIRSFRRSTGKKGAYQIPVGRQQEFCCSARRRRPLAESAANKKVARISDGCLGFSWLYFFRRRLASFRKDEYYDGSVKWK